MIELMPEPDAERIALPFAERMRRAIDVRDRFEAAIRNVPAESLAGSIWDHIETWGDIVIFETYILNLIEGYALPAIAGRLAGTRDRPIRGRLETIVSAMDENVRKLGGTALEMHGMKATKLQRTILEATIHAEYLACYTVRRLATDGLATLPGEVSNPSRNELQ